MIEAERYRRQAILEGVGEKGQSLIQDAQALVIGAGGLGVPVIQYLAGAGIGKILIADGDALELSNLHRQVMYRTSDVGTNKALLAQKVVQSINPNVKCETISQRLDFDNIVRLSENTLILDATDNFDSRYAINDAALINNVPVVCGAIHKWQGQVTVYNYKGGPTYRCLFPDENKLGFGCSEIGVPGPLVGIIGSMMACEALKIIIGSGEILTGKLRSIDARSNEWRDFTYVKNNEEVEKQRSVLMKQLNHEAHVD